MENMRDINDSVHMELLEKLEELGAEDRQRLIRELAGEGGMKSPEKKSDVVGMVKMPALGMVHLKLSCGFEMDIDEDRLDDQELLDSFLQLRNEPANYGVALRLMIGQDKKNELYECLRNEKGRVPATAVVEAFHEIVARLKQVKK